MVLRRTDGVDNRIGAFIVGAEKAGTSEIAARLESHPMVAGHTRIVLEYPGFIPSSLGGVAASEPRLELFGGSVEDGSILLAKQVDMMYRPESLGRLQNHNSECRLICALRNPVDRAYSSYWYQRYRGAEWSRSFEQAIDREMKSGVQGERLDTSYLLKSRYDLAIRAIAERFPLNQVKIIIFEEYIVNSIGVLSDVFGFLGLDTPNKIQTGDSNAARMVRSDRIAGWVFSDNRIKKSFRLMLPEGVRRRLYHGLRKVNSVERRPPAMAAETRARLNEYFAASVDDVESLLDRDLKKWWGRF